MQLTMRNDRHVSDIGRLVHELTDLYRCQPWLFPYLELEVE